MAKKRCSCCNKFLKPKSHLSVIQDEQASGVLKAAFNSSLWIKSKVCDTCRYFSIKKRRITDTSSFEYNISNISESDKVQSSKNPESSS